MANKINIAIIHGVGITEPGYSKPLANGIKKEFNKIIQKRLNERRDFTDQINDVEIVWDDILSASQRKLDERLKAGFKKLGSKNIFENIVGKILFLPKKGMNFVRTKFAAEYVGDIIGYLNDEARTKIYKRFNETLDLVKTNQDKENVSIIAHSLGSVITSDYVYDQQSRGKTIHQGLELHNFFSFGSPIALFALRYGVETFTSPIKMDNSLGRWINIFDRDDPIAYPLKSLNEAYENAVTKDLEVNTGLFGVSHVRYWNNKATHRIIASKLAEDWLRHQ